MQFSISGIFQKHEQDLFEFPSPGIPRSFRQKIKALISSPLTFVILVWAMMFFFASLYFVYAQEEGKPTVSNSLVSPKAIAGGDKPDE